MMRIVLIILAFYTVALSCIPCQDEAPETAYGESVTIIKTTPIEQNTSHADLCSPFCICSCCAGITLEQEVPCLPLKACFTVFEEHNFSYTPNSDSGNLSSIWQPPRV